MTFRLATIAGLPGILTAIDRRAAERGQNRAQVLARCGMAQADWDAINTALGTVNAANLRKLLNASHAVLLLEESSTAISEAAGGAVSSASFNAPITSRYGDLSA